MKPTYLALIGLLALAGCNSAQQDLEPLPQSLTYGENAASRKTQAAPGAMIQNRFMYEGQMVYETYEVQPDRTYKLVRRRMDQSGPAGNN
ncbi:MULTISPECIES: hypothetical protein [Ensifer]|uniref:Transmembrane protein n=1 Tax=Ensifer adhaerens TaxID=106592 RepID=A0ABY8HIK0_ENSAD|nr:MULTISPECIES: hypothetical protein [Ensifer]OWZ91971.1 hypothetical protein B9J07_18665 [Sinorhizobium sp. LM21]ANK72168.1 hypothetical protein FA04_05730 [Ensifer adhaerens]KDP74402.1 hypothetical protein FA04_07305 [Ensifer adhaerens]KQX21175.1 hypothetical protein ASD01_30730 [Ensifer sp. Root423]KQZ41587.1 hypothetical protein ASD63_15295 [Ensifer sp. Root558]